MSKLELWEFLKTDGKWHKAADLRERFNVRQQITLKNWTDVPFIMSNVSNKGKYYRFNTQFEELYDKAVEAEIYVPPIKLKNGKEVAADIPDAEPEYYTLTFPFLKNKLGDVTERQLKGIAGLSSEWDHVKEVILSVEEHKYDTDRLIKEIIQSLIVSLAGIMEYNGHNFEGIQAIRESLKSEETLEDIQAAELKDIMDHLPVAKPKDIFNQEDIDYDSFFGKAT